MPLDFEPRRGLGLLTAVEPRPLLTDEFQDRVLGDLLLSRGWTAIQDDSSWEWKPADVVAQNSGLYAVGPCVMCLEDGPGYLIEGPAAVDVPGPCLIYQTRQEVIDRLDRLEAWRYPLEARDFDLAHLQV